MSLHLERGPDNKIRATNPILTAKGLADYHKMFDQLAKQHLDLIKGFEEEPGKTEEAKKSALYFEGNFREACELLIKAEIKLGWEFNIKTLKKEISSFLDRFNPMQ